MLDAGDAVWFAGTREPTELHVWRLTVDGSVARVSDGEGQHSAVIAGDLGVLVSETVDEPLPTARLVRDGETLHTFDRAARRPSSRAVRRSSPWALTSSGRRCSFRRARSRDRSPCCSIRTGAALRARGPRSAAAPRVAVVRRPGVRGARDRRSGHAVPRRLLGTVGAPQLPRSRARGPGRRLARRGRQVSVPRSVAGGDQGWSYGGYLTLGALLRRPDVFRAGISGAPVTDMRLYDTHYTERTSACPTRMSRRTRTPT